MPSASGSMMRTSMPGRGLQTVLEILQDERDKADVRDLIFREGFTDKFRAQRAEMHDRSSTNERSEKSDHEVDRVVGGQNAEIAETGCEGIEGSQSNALL